MSIPEIDDEGMSILLRAKALVKAAGNLTEAQSDGAEVIKRLSEKAKAKDREIQNRLNHAASRSKSIMTPSIVNHEDTNSYKDGCSLEGKGWKRINELRVTVFTGSSLVTVHKNDPRHFIKKNDFVWLNGQSYQVHPEKEITRSTFDLTTDYKGQNIMEGPLLIKSQQLNSVKVRTEAWEKIKIPDGFENKSTTELIESLLPQQKTDQRATKPINHGKTEKKNYRAKCMKNFTDSVKVDATLHNSNTTEENNSKGMEKVKIETERPLSDENISQNHEIIRKNTSNLSKEREKSYGKWEPSKRLNSPISKVNNQSQEAESPESLVPNTVTISDVGNILSNLAKETRQHERRRRKTYFNDKGIYLTTADPSMPKTMIEEDKCTLYSSKELAKKTKKASNSFKEQEREKERMKRKEEEARESDKAFRERVKVEEALLVARQRVLKTKRQQEEEDKRKEEELKARRDSLNKSIAVGIQNSKEAAYRIAVRKKEARKEKENLALIYKREKEMKDRESAMKQHLWTKKWTRLKSITEARMKKKKELESALKHEEEVELKRKLEEYKRNQQAQRERYFNNVKKIVPKSSFPKSRATNQEEIKPENNTKLTDQLPSGKNNDSNTGETTFDCSEAISINNLPKRGQTSQLCGSRRGKRKLITSEDALNISEEDDGLFKSQDNLYSYGNGRKAATAGSISRSSDLNEDYAFDSSSMGEMMQLHLDNDESFLLSTEKPKVPPQTDQESTCNILPSMLPQEPYMSETEAQKSLPPLDLSTIPHGHIKKVLKKKAVWKQQPIPLAPLSSYIRNERKW